MHQQQRWRNVDFYQVLCVEASASATEIKHHFRKQALRVHPDKDGGDEAAFKELNEAYQVLSDARQRAHYDAVRAYVKDHGADAFNAGDNSGQDEDYVPEPAPDDPTLRDMPWSSPHSSVRRMWRALTLAILAFALLCALSSALGLPLAASSVLLVELALVARVSLPLLHLILVAIVHLVASFLVSLLVPRVLLEVIATVAPFAVVVAASQLRALAFDAALTSVVAAFVSMRSLQLLSLLPLRLGVWWTLLSAHAVVASVVALVILLAQAASNSKVSQRPALLSYSLRLWRDRVPENLRVRLVLVLVTPARYLFSATVWSIFLVVGLFTLASQYIKDWIARDPQAQFYQQQQQQHNQHQQHQQGRQQHLRGGKRRH